MKTAFQTLILSLISTSVFAYCFPSDIPETPSLSGKIKVSSWEREVNFPGTLCVRKDDTVTIKLYAEGLDSVTFNWSDNPYYDIDKQGLFHTGDSLELSFYGNFSQHTIYLTQSTDSCESLARQITFVLAEIPEVSIYSTSVCENGYREFADLHFAPETMYEWEVKGQNRISSEFGEDLPTYGVTFGDSDTETLIVKKVTEDMCYAYDTLVISNDCSITLSESLVETAGVFLSNDEIVISNSTDYINTSIIDISGREVLSSEKTHIPLYSLQSGIYILNIRYRDLQRQITFYK